MRLTRHAVLAASLVVAGHFVCRGLAQDSGSAHLDTSVLPCSPACAHQEEPPRAAWMDDLPPPPARPPRQEPPPPLAPAAPPLAAQDPPPAPKPEDPKPEEPKQDDRPKDPPPAVPPAEPKPETPTPPAAPAPDAPPARTPDPDAPTPEEDAAARKVLGAAAERQGGERLAPPAGSIGSFHVVFGKVTLHREEKGADGKVTRRRIDSEDPGLVIDWKAGQIRTSWRLTGERATTRGLVVRPNGQQVAWLDDGGTTPTILVGAAYAKDREEIDRDLRIVRSLLDVAVLRRLLGDGSRWKVVEDASRRGTALRRTPPKDAPDALRVTLWVDPGTNDVLAARLPGSSKDESDLLLEFEYDDEFPKVKDGVVRFPFRFTVKERRPGAAETLPLMVATAREASFNDVADSVFLPPKR